MISASAQEESIYEETRSEIDLSYLNVSVVDGKKLKYNPRSGFIKKIVGNREKEKLDDLLVRIPEYKDVLIETMNHNEPIHTLSLVNVPVVWEEDHYERVKKENTSILQTILRPLAISAYASNSTIGKVGDESPRGVFTMVMAVSKQYYEDEGEYKYKTLTTAQWGDRSWLGGENYPATGEGDIMKKKRVLIIVLSLLCVVIIIGGVSLLNLFNTTVKGDYETLKAEFAMNSALKQSQLVNLEYEAIFPSELDAIDNSRYGLYVAVNEETRDRAEMGIIRRTGIGDLFGRAWIVDYVTSENSVGSYLMTDESGNGQFLIFYSANYERIDRAEIKYKNSEDIEIDEDINPNFPLRYVISELGTTENSTKQIEYVAFCSDADELVYEYKPT